MGAGFALTIFIVYLVFGIRYFNAAKAATDRHDPAVRKKLRHFQVAIVVTAIAGICIYFLIYRD
jgi:Ca2+/Na+ antiporter